MTAAITPAERRSFLLALAQFICSFAGSNMNVMINDITEDLDTITFALPFARKRNTGRVPARLLRPPSGCRAATGLWPKRSSVASAPSRRSRLIHEG